MFYQTNREQAIVDDLYIKHMVVSRSNSQQMEEQSKAEKWGIQGDNFHFFSRQAADHFSALILHNVFFLINQ